jgi:hypothetical protein
MRQLNIEELEDKIRDYASKTEYIDRLHLNIKLRQFLNFLESQPISQRLLQRIEENFAELKSKIPKGNTPIYDKQKREIINSIETPEQQGAFGYFLINEINNSNIDDYDEDMYLELTRRWYDFRGDYDQTKEDFIKLLFKPFVELVFWYISESQSYNSNDYFSKKEITEFSEKLDNLLDDIRLGQEVIFEEIQDLKEQLKNLKKKNWAELLKGKLFDLTLTKVISIETFSMIIKTITGEDLKSLM